ncbi:lysosomal alpha-mannosidase, partial [Nannochloropsis gaditana]
FLPPSLPSLPPFSELLIPPAHPARPPARPPSRPPSRPFQAVFTGVFPSGNYGPPPGFCFDQFCADAPINDNPSLTDENVQVLPPSIPPSLPPFSLPSFPPSSLLDRNFGATWGV